MRRVHYGYLPEVDKSKSKREIEGEIRLLTGTPGVASTISPGSGFSLASIRPIVASTRSLIFRGFQACKCTQNIELWLTQIISFSSSDQGLLVSPARSG